MGGQFNLSSGFSKTVFYGNEVKPCFFVTFNIFIRHIFHKNFINIPSSFRKIWRFSSLVLTIFINCFIFWHFVVANKLMTSVYNRWCQNFFYLQPTLNMLFNNCLKLYWHIRSSWNMRRVLMPYRKKLPSKSSTLIGLIISMPTYFLLLVLETNW